MQILQLILAILVSNCLIALAPTAIAAESSPFDRQISDANRLLDEGKLQEALASVKTAAKLDSNRFEAPFLAAVIFVELKQPTPARLALETALALAPAEKKARLEALKQQLANAVSPGPRSESTTNAAVVNNDPLRQPPTAKTEVPSLSAAARRQHDTLVLIIEEADKAKLADDRKKLLCEFMEKSEAFLKENPGQFPIWTLRAVAALELNQAKAGWEAGRKMIEAGAGNSKDSKIRKVLASLERKGWLGEESPKVEASAVESPVAGVHADKPTAEQQPKVSAFSDAAKQAALESICGTWEWSDIFSTGTITVKPDGACIVDWNVMGHYRYDGRITDCDSKGTTFTTSLTEAGSHKRISIPVRKVSADRIKWNGGKFKKRQAL